eukprot:TRINITY_DN1772_c0_g1_i1.p1 TRINITY_DN1772_c0_g1~~TRINITY_DN1772_c0_g1_i1.p1  ORF type:complete len:1448 (+),score=361.17 TRINITY_DN1772_c0_g1_i1:50-4393(+)
MSHSFVAVLQTDLRALSAEAKRRHPEVRDAADKAILKLKAIEDKGETDVSMVSEAVAKTDDVLHPFMLAVDSKNSKMVLLAVNCLQLLLSRNAVSSTSIKAVVSAFALQVDGADEVLQLKILQAVLALVTVTMPANGPLMQALDICFRLSLSKSPAVVGTAQASLRQIVGHLFEKVKDEEAGDAFVLFQDICLLANGDSAKYLQTSSLSMEFGLELIETVLSAHVDVLRKMPKYTVLLRERVCSVLIKAIGGRSTFPVAVRMYNCVKALVRLCGDLLVTECEIFLSMLVKTLEQETPIWLKAATLEVIRTFCGDPQLLKNFFIHYDLEPSSTKIFQETVNQLSKFVQTSFVTDEGVTVHTTIARMKCLENHHDVDPPTLPATYSISLAAGGLAAVVDALHSLRESDPKMCSQMVQTSWLSVLAGLGYLLQNANDEAIIQSVLNAYQSMVNTCGTLGLATPRDAFVTSLCKFAVPEASIDGLPFDPATAVLTGKNVLTMKSLLNIAHGLGGILGTSWRTVLEALEQLFLMITTQKHKELSSELNILSAALAQLFNSTPFLDEQAILHLIEALGQLTRTSLDSAITARVIRQLGPPELFGVGKLVDTALKNVSRIMIFWDHIHAQLQDVAYHKMADVRMHGVDCLSKLIVAALHSTCERRQQLKAEGAPETALTACSADEKRVLQSLFDLYSKSPHVDTRTACMGALFHLLQAAGQDITSGWALLLGLLDHVASDDDKAVIPSAFRSVQMICHDFILNIPADCLERCISVIGRYCLQRVDVNISLTAIGLLWDFADFLKKQHESIMSALSTSGDGKASSPGAVYGNLWLHIFAHMETLSPDPRAEVRNCALRTLFSTLTTHGDVLIDDAWHALVWQILFPVLDYVKAGSAKTDEPRDTALERAGQRDQSILIMLHHTRNTVEKQWDESRMLALQGVLRVFRTFAPALARLPQYQDAWKRLMAHAAGFGCLGSIELTVATISGMQELLSSELLRPGFELSQWDRSLTVWDEIAQHVCKVFGYPEKPVNALVEGLKAMYAKVQPQLRDSDLLWLMKLLDYIALNTPHNRVQKGALELLQVLPPVSEPVYLALFAQFQNYLRLPIATAEEMQQLMSAMTAASIRATPGQAMRNSTGSGEVSSLGSPLSRGSTNSEQLASAAVAAASSEGTMPHKAVPSFIKTALAAVVELFQKATTAVQARVFAEVLACLKEVIGNPGEHCSLWVAAVQAFIDISRVAVTAINSDVSADADAAAAWDAVHTILVIVLDFDRLKQRPAELEDISVAVVNLLVSELLPQSHRASAQARTNLLDILAEGSEYEREGSLPIEPFSEACLRGLFSLCTRDDDPARVAAPRLQQRCTKVLQKFAADDRASGQLPLPRIRLAEVQFLLAQLAELQSPISLFTSRFQTDRALLCKLFPLLCDCVVTKENGIRELLANALRILGRQVQLDE